VSGRKLAVVATDADFVAVLNHHFTDGAKAWAMILSAAKKAAADRLLREALAEMRALTERLPSLTGVDWRAEQDRFDVLDRRIAELNRLAFPEQFAGVPHV
jgi:hypothetical protein